MDRLENLQQMVSKFVADRNWQSFHNPKNLSMSIAIESAELMELFQWISIEESNVKSENDHKFRAKIEDELADVLIYCISLANATNIDLIKIVTEKMKRNDLRFPPKSVLK